jgi:hypothetical protein
MPTSFPFSVTGSDPTSSSRISIATSRKVISRVAVVTLLVIISRQRRLMFPEFAVSDIFLKPAQNFSDCLYFG